MRTPDPWERRARLPVRRSDWLLLGLGLLTVGVTLNRPRLEQLRVERAQVVRVMEDVRLRPHHELAVALDSEVERTHALLAEARVEAARLEREPASDDPRLALWEAVSAAERLVLDAEDGLRRIEETAYRLPSLDQQLGITSAAIHLARIRLADAVSAARLFAGWDFPLDRCDVRVDHRGARACQRLSPVGCASDAECVVLPGPCGGPPLAVAADGPEGAPERRWCQARASGCPRAPGTVDVARCVSRRCVARSFTFPPRPAKATRWRAPFSACARQTVDVLQPGEVAKVSVTVGAGGVPSEVSVQPERLRGSAFGECLVAAARYARYGQGAAGRVIVHGVRLPEAP